MNLKTMLHHVSEHDPGHRQSVVQLGLDVDTKDTLKHRHIEADDVVSDQDRCVVEDGSHLIVVMGVANLIPVLVGKDVNLGCSLQ